MHKTPRRLQTVLDRVMRTRRVAVLVGPRQAGKTTLVRDHLAGQPNGTFVRLDDPMQQDAVRANPRRALAGPRPVVVDEVQRASDDVVRLVKLAVDDDPSPGQFRSPARRTSWPCRRSPSRWPGVRRC